jgi:cytidylate kinase
MSETYFFERCRTYIDCHLRPPLRAGAGDWVEMPSVTISRQAGTGGISVAQALATWLQEHAPKSTCPWTVFDKNLVQRVLEDHNLPARIAQFMPEDKGSSVSDAVEELLGLHPASWKLVRQTTETILQLAELGNAILVGRGANVITAHLDPVFHVRLVGSLARRAERIMAASKIGRRAALAFIKKEDTGRQRYLRRYFGQNIDDPLLYHLTLNTDHVQEKAAAELVGRAVLARFYSRSIGGTTPGSARLP